MDHLPSCKDGTSLYSVVKAMDLNPHQNSAEIHCSVNFKSIFIMLLWNPLNIPERIDSCWNYISLAELHSCFWRRPWEDLIHCQYKTYPQSWHSLLERRSPAASVGRFAWSGLFYSVPATRLIACFHTLTFACRTSHRDQ